ncbi:hypothetical protein CCACVL1_30141 [Corchorus capsularis]|uniref:Uncharacterized protein n=1 Tax=Corchorus capsularis TaxID=210143 RepID=A0A1R3FYN5_COCAP|nr:hypothetical protein CCACVL1_30141 [Corchorus capsularis]
MEAERHQEEEEFCCHGSNSKSKPEQFQVDMAVAVAFAGRNLLSSNLGLS